MALDSNGHSTLWNYELNNSRGDSLESWILQNHLLVLNNGQRPTFVNHQGSTIIDITLTDHSLHNQICNWHVNPNDQMSDHRRIEFTLEFEQKQTIITRSLNKANWGKFKRNLMKTPKMIEPFIWT